MRYAGWLKYSEGFAREDDEAEGEGEASVFEGVMRKVSPAPSQSLDVIIGVCTCTKPLSCRL